MQDKRLIVALDVDDIDRARKIIAELSGIVSYFKVGSELFTAAGPEILTMVADAGAKTFLDLKFFDIPNTVSRAIRSVSRHEISMVNVHCLGGNAMMRAAKEAALSSRAGPLVLGVTILTSLDGKDLSDIGFPHSPQDAVLLLARNAKAAGLDGVISSPHEVNMLRRELGGDFVLVTPGVRPAWSEAGDQKRVMTPREAIDAGADYIVVGRPIVASSDIRGAAQRVIEEISS